MSGPQTTITSEAHIYDPASGTFKLISPMTARRVGNTATLLADGKILIAGQPKNFGSTAELFDPVTETFMVTGGPTLYGVASATRLLNDDVLVTGGQPSGGSTNYSPGAELYDHATGSFSVVGPLRASHSAYTATLLLNGKVLLVGGLTESQTTAAKEVLSSAELYE
jgi:N-acetylneuraminic acid mutarotase